MELGFEKQGNLTLIKLEKPIAPTQVDLELLADVLDIVVEMKTNEKEVLLRMDKLDEWANEKENNMTNIVENKFEKELLANSTKFNDLEKKEGNEGYITVNKLELIKIHLNIK